MLRGMIKKFFWSMVFSSIVMIGAQFTPVKEHVNTLLKKQLAGLQSGASRAIASGPESLKKLLPMPDTKDGVLTTQELRNTVGERKEVSSSSTEYVFNNDQYVLIRGKYYKARPDNTYMIDGEKVFYVSDRTKRGRNSQEAILAKNGSGSRTPSDQGYNGRAPEGLEGSDIKLPTNPAEMMKTLQKAQENMKRRNEMLKEFSQ